MYKLDGMDMELTRGDSLLFELRFDGRDVEPGAEALFSVKRSLRDDTPAIQKRMPIANGRVVVALSPTDTRLAPGSYWWDVRVITPAPGGVQVCTPMGYAAFEILEVVGDD